MAVAALWTTAEYLMSTASPHGTFWSVAYTQAGFLPVVQLASVFGVWGITFLVMFAGAAAAALLPPGGGTRRFAAASAAAIGLALVFGVWRLQSGPAVVETATIGLAAVDDPGGPRPADDPAARGVLSAYERQVSALGSRHADVVVLPETVARVSDSNIEDVEAVFRRSADSRGMYVVVGLARESGGIQQNEALAIRSGAAPAARYAKQYLIPGLEARYRPGQQLTVLETANAPWGLAICKDMDFPALGRRYGERRVALLLVPAWDFDRDGWLHSRMAMMRGVESGFAVARSARRGLLTVSDAYGRVLAEANSASGPATTLTADVGLARLDTIYRRFGDWFAWLNAVALTWFLGLAIRAPRVFVTS
jgi:apolipoprotein N-acyltransferase